jgi:hypothetical protein
VSDVLSGFDDPENRRFRLADNLAHRQFIYASGGEVGQIGNVERDDRVRPLVGPAQVAANEKAITNAARALRRLGGPGIRPAVDPI